MTNDDLWCVKMADSEMKRTPVFSFSWSYDYGVVMKGLEYVWKITGDKKYYDYIKKNMDVFVEPRGFISRYQPGEYNIDHINNGKILFFLFRETKEEKYHRIERAYGSFYRSFTIPHYIDQDKIKAEHENGILKVTMPKKAELKPKKVKVLKPQSKAKK